MSDVFLETITARDDAVRDRALDDLCRGRSLAELLRASEELERFRHATPNHYERVRALFFLYAIHRYHVPTRPELAPRGTIPWAGWLALCRRDFEEALRIFRARVDESGVDDAIVSALAATWRALGFQTLADQVRRSVRELPANRWMFAHERARDTPCRIAPELRAGGRLVERTPVRMDLTHSAWSDIFFLAMDHPEGAKVVNVSIDLGVHGRDARPEPPIETTLAVIDEPRIRLESIDLGAHADVDELDELFDFARDHLGLLKAGLIASGVVPPSLEGSGEELSDLLAALVGPGRGLALSTRVRGIPRGSRLAVSTNLLASIIALAMRASGQTEELTGPLAEGERRIVCARAILGEWLGGSGGGWQDSGGLWPSIKRIEGALCQPGDPSFGKSRGRLIPNHRPLAGEVHPEALRRLGDSLVLVHGGMAQDVGPILEMVTERYLLRTPDAWRARNGAVVDVLAAIEDALARGDVRSIGRATEANFRGPIRTIVPWATNLFTERVIDRVRARLGDAFWGFWMLGGMSGGGMGFLFDPAHRARGRDELALILGATKHELESALPFAIDPVVYDFRVNEVGSTAELLSRAPDAEPAPPAAAPARALEEEDLEAVLERAGFDRAAHERVRADLLAGRIGLARNRLPASTRVADVEPGDLVDALGAIDATTRAVGERALRDGRVGVLTLAGGSGSRWTQGAGIAKALFPFARLGGEHRRFLEVHLAKTLRTGASFGAVPPHVVTTSRLTDGPIRAWLAALPPGARPSGLRVSSGRSIGRRLVPCVRDLEFAWRESQGEQLDERAQKVRESLENAWMRWARASGEGSDYDDNLPSQCLHPIGHAYEVPNLLLNGTLARLLDEQPALTTLMLHNVDTLGAGLDPGYLGLHLERAAAFTFEVVPRRLGDAGGGLARVDGGVRLIEGSALPREEDELSLSTYNSMTTWIEIDRLLELFGLERGDLGDEERVAGAVRELLARFPTYVTLKEVKKRWGHGHEDVFPVAQYEKLWSDVTTLPEADCAFLVVPRARGQQLKETAQLDGWLRDGSASFVERLCGWDRD